MASEALAARLEAMVAPRARTSRPKASLSCATTKLVTTTMRATTRKAVMPANFVRRDRRARPLALADLDLDFTFSMLFFPTSGFLRRDYPKVKGLFEAIIVNTAFNLFVDIENHRR